MYKKEPEQVAQETGGRPLSVAFVSSYGGLGGSEIYLERLLANKGDERAQEAPTAESAFLARTPPLPHIRLDAIVRVFLAHCGPEISRLLPK